MPEKRKMGFACLSKEKRIEIARKGGIAGHQKGTAHEWNTKEAQEAGRIGGKVSRGGRGKLIS